MPLARDLDKYERNTIKYLRNIGELTPEKFGSLDVLYFTPKNRDGYYYKSKPKKDLILLHFTMGFLGGDLGQLTKNNYHVSVPFVIARNGTIIQLFDSFYWSYHLGTSAVGGNKFNSKRSLAVELSNIGPLQKSGKWLWNYYGDRYCEVSENEFYEALGTEYRGYQYYATFTDAQYISLKKLLEVISIKYDIPLTFIPEPDRFKKFSTSEDARSYNGVVSHVNFRGVTEKTDIGPAFNWELIV